MTNPKPFLDKLISQRVSMRVMSGAMYYGTLLEVDDNCNLTLSDAEEHVFGEVRKKDANVKLLKSDVMYVRRESTDAAKSTESAVEKSP